MVNRGNMKKWVMLVSLAFVMVVSGEVAGIGTTSAAGKPIKLRMMVPGEPTPRGFTPMGGYSYAGSPAIVTRNILEPLVDVGNKGEPVPKLAIKWEHSTDFTKWRFYLRKGVKFHNGDNFTSRDVMEMVKWNFEEKKVSELYGVLPVKDAVAVDDYTVDLIFEEPQPLLLLSIGAFLINPAAISRDNRKLAETHPIGTGPYRFLEWRRGLDIKLTKFEGYWGPKPQIDDVEVTFRGEEQVRLAALMAGEVDWVSNLSPESAARASKEVHRPSTFAMYLRFDEYIQKELGRESILADKRLRLAVEYAIDRKALISLYAGFATPSQGQFASPADFGFNPNLKNRPYDLEKAKVLVREAGAVGKTLTFAASTDRWIKDKEVAEAIAYMIEKTGLKVKLMLMPFVELKKYTSVKGEDRQYMADITMKADFTLLQTEPHLVGFFVEGGKQCAINDTEPTRLYKKVEAEFDYAKRQEMVAKLWAYIYEQAHYVPLFRLPVIWGVAKNLGWAPDITERPSVADMRFID